MQVDNLALITLPDYEDTVFYLTKWSEEIVKKAPKIKFLPLENERANKEQFESYILKKEPKFLILNGHGDENTVCGHNHLPLLNKETPSEIVKGRLIFARACSSAAALGPACKEKGTKMYIGYAMPFVFLVDPSYSARPLQDTLAGPVLEWSNTTAVSMLQDVSKKQIQEKSMIHFKKIERNLKTHYTPETEGVLACLRWDMMAQRIIS